jgi:hypothetical protein
MEQHAVFPQGHQQLGANPRYFDEGAKQRGADTHVLYGGTSDRLVWRRWYRRCDWNVNEALPVHKPLERTVRRRAEWLTN